MLSGVQNLFSDIFLEIIDGYFHLKHLWDFHRICHNVYYLWIWYHDPPGEVTSGHHLQIGRMAVAFSIEETSASLFILGSRTVAGGRLISCESAINV